MSEAPFTDVRAARPTFSRFATFRFGSLVALALVLAGCADREPAEPPEPRVTLEPVAFEALDGWAADDHEAALRTFERSCSKIGRVDPGKDWGVAGRVSAWQQACREAERAQGDARRFFETAFNPWRVRFGDESTGLFTGYYEPLLDGARRPDARHTVPIRARPADLIDVDLGAFDPELKGRRLAGRIQDARLVPYPDRAAIDHGAIDAQAPAVVWVDDPVAKFFLQIQGSGQVRLADGETMRIGYAAQNGRAYRAIGRDLIEMGALTRENVSLQSIRRWLEEHPDRAAEIMERNGSYVFFRELTELNGAEGPLGAQNVPLEPGRSLAVDRKFWPLGMPVWLQTTAPFPEGDRPLHRLLIAQDTGGAIRGPIRGDVFWGAGDLAEHVAGHMKSDGSMIVLLPRESAPTS